ncbi:MAG: hypothetical protein WCL44_04165 [bacterium]
MYKILRMRAKLKILGLLLLAAVSSGCRHLACPPLTHLSTSQSGVAAAYDSDRDGKGDFFILSNTVGRASRIGYSAAASGKADVVVDLDEIPFDRCRHMVIILDGFGYDLVDKYYRSGGLSLFHAPSRVVASYPAVTELSLSGILGAIPCLAVQSKYFDHKNNSIAGGFTDYVAGKYETYARSLTYRASSRIEGAAWLYPWRVFDSEMEEIERTFQRRTDHEVLAYVASSAAVSCLLGEEGQIECLQKVDRLITRLVWQTRGLVKVTLLADHGQSLVVPRRTDITAHLIKRGWNPSDSLRDDHDFHVMRFGLMTVACLATRAPARLASDVVSCEGAELASYAEQESVVVVSHSGNKAAIHKKHGRYRYEQVDGDPLELGEILSQLKADTDGYYDADELLHATVRHKYPNPLERLWEAHYALVENPPDVIVSLSDGFCFGSEAIGKFVTLASTHGSLNYRNGETFIMSTAWPLPSVMRYWDIPTCMRAITGSSWPLVK